ncbi:hypothetical protein SDC9_192733 [bioreactor metagenome]|uniref:Uncharacterized protein n=1 Tax=bioreactor metagenome TaxID=1076179 RepID=A0A645I2S3_9ZZZZ
MIFIKQFHLCFIIPTVEQPRELVMETEELHFLLFQSFFGEIAEHQHRAGNVAVFVENRGGAVLNKDARAVAGNQNRMVGQFERFARFQHPLNGVFDRLAREFVDDVEYFRQWSACGLVERPAGQSFRYMVENDHASLGVRGNHPVTNRQQRGFKHLFFLV